MLKRSNEGGTVAASLFISSRSSSTAADAARAALSAAAARRSADAAAASARSALAITASKAACDIAFVIRPSRTGSSCTGCGADGGAGGWVGGIAPATSTLLPGNSNSVLVVSSSSAYLTSPSYEMSGQQTLRYSISSSSLSSASKLRALSSQPPRLFRKTPRAQLTHAQLARQFSPSRLTRRGISASAVDL